jgi:hypothetical protein
MNLQRLNDKQNLKVILNKSKDCLVNAINLDPDNYIFWNTLGVLYATNGIIIIKIFTDLNQSSKLRELILLKSN